MKKTSVIDILSDRLDISIAEISRQTKIPSISLYKIKGDRNITPKLIKKITSVFKEVNPEFLKGTDNRVLLTDTNNNEPQSEAPKVYSNYKTPAERVKAIRNHVKRMTVSEFAEFLNIHRSTLAAVEMGSQLPNIKMLMELKKRKLITCMDEIIDGTNPVLDASKNTNIGEMNKLNQTIYELTRQNQELKNNKGESTNNSGDYNELLTKYKILEEEFEKFKKMAYKAM